MSEGGKQAWIDSCTNYELKQENARLRKLLYKAAIKFNHRRNPNKPNKFCGDIPAECKTWYDGCNCIIPYDEFDDKEYSKAKQALEAGDE